MQRSIVVVIFLGAVLLGSVAVAPPASACSCVATDIDTVLDNASAAFVGVAVDRTDAGQGIRWGFEVETVLAGELSEFVVVSSGYGGGDCGHDFSQSGRVGVVAHSRDAGLATSICGGVWAAQELLEVHGPGYAPLSSQRDEPTPASGTPVWWWIAGGSALLVLATGLVVRSMRRRDYHDGWSAPS